MTSKRKVHSAKFKSKVALDALRERETLSELAQKHQLNPNQISQWKQQLMQGSESIFERKRGVRPKAQTEKEQQLYEQIGRLQMELAWLKKKSGM